MANQTPYYFLAPTWDFPPPPAGPIRLGNVIASLKTPERALFAPPASADLNAFSTEQRNVTFSTEKLRSSQCSIFTRFLSFVLGVGVDATVGWEGSAFTHLRVPTLATTQFSPTPDYIASCISSPVVRRFLSKARYNKPVYIITGLKIAHGGATAKSVKGNTIGASLGAEVDATVFSAVPIATGPEVSVAQGKKTDVSWDGGSDFVFAFKVRKLVVGKGDVVRKEGDYTRGAMLGCETVITAEGDELRVVGEEEVREEEGFEILQLDGEDGACWVVPTQLQGI